ncbi:MAG: MFS transporter [Pseudomonadales bacterium]|nr:MFS transporter [Pseudomonadales bacterium]
MSSHPTEGQFRLLVSRRFAPLFFAQFFGAFNDNLFRSAIILIFVFGGLIDVQASNIYVNLAAGIFILPFFLFSAVAGQLADRYDKAMLIRLTKGAEVVVAGLASVAVLTQSVAGMLGVLFLLGVQSTFFGPLKYAILPQHLRETELVGGNAQVEMGTFVAILLGTIAGGVIAGLQDVGMLLSAGVIGIAVAGFIGACLVPAAPPVTRDGTVSWNLWRETVTILRLSRERNSVFLSILGISWFWLLGSAMTAQIANLTRLHLAGDSTVVTLVLAVFTLSIAVGSLACERLSGQRIEIGLVPLGAAGLSLAGIDLYFAVTGLLPVPEMDWGAFLQRSGGLHVLADVFLAGLSGGLFIVPLYALVQIRTPADRRARIIAANNIINSVFMVVSSLIAIVLLELAGLSIPELLLTLFVMNIVVSVFVFQQVPEFVMRFLVWALSHTMYRVTHENLEAIPEQGGAVLVCNHVTYVDALLLAGAVRRPIRFIMFKPIFRIPVLNFIFRTGGAIPIDSRTVDPEGYEAAFAAIHEGLAAGDLLCIFPEGALTRDGDIAEFRRGVERIVRETPVPVVPMALRGLWGSFFSHEGEGVFKPKGRFWSRVHVVAGEPVPPEAVSAAMLEARVRALRGASA